MSSGGLEIREMRPNEMQVMIEMEQKELYSELSPSQIKSWIEGQGMFAPQCFVAETDGIILGFIVFTPYDVRDKEVLLELSVIAVKKELQRHGIGKRLLETSLAKTIRHWRTQGFRVTGLIIETSEDEEEPQAFYENVLPTCQKKVFENAWSDGTGVVFYFVSLFHQ